MMADVSKNYSCRRIVTQATGADNVWGVPVVCPIACTQVVIENADQSNAQAVRSDPNDGDTEKQIPAGLELTIRATSSGDPVFQPGEVVCRVAPASGNGPIVVTFIR
jgi:hypothetical protein